MKRLSALAAALMLGATPAVAKKAEQRRFTPIPSAPAVTLDPAKAYLIIRCKGHPKCIPPILMRVPSVAEVADHKARGTELGNVHVFNQKTAFETSATGATYLLASDPGRIVVYGIGVPLAFQSCFCLGTVSAEVKAGEITDFGASVMGLAADPSPYPELATLTGRGDSFRMDMPLAVGALTPANRDMPRPAALSSLKLAPAAFRAEGPFFDANARSATYLPPIDGVLDYRRGRVLDVRTGELLPDLER